MKALEQVQPKDLDASEIAVRLGATWIPPEYIQDFLMELLEPPLSTRLSVKVLFASFTGEWNITNKRYGNGSIKQLSPTAQTARMPMKSPRLH